MRISFQFCLLTPVSCPLLGWRISWSNWLDILANWSLQQLICFWLGIIIVFGFIYWVAGIGMGWGLQAGNTEIRPDLNGLGTAIYFSFVTALSIGYGDIIPVGPLRILAVTEGIAGLLIFGCVISKLVSRRQEELVEEIHRTTFEDRLDRVRTNLHLVFADLEAMDQINRQHSALSDQVLRRFESSVRVFTGELKTIHDLLYRSQLLPEEDALESLLANLALCLESLTDLLNGQPNLFDWHNTIEVPAVSNVEVNGADALYLDLHIFAIQEGGDVAYFDFFHPALLYRCLRRHTACWRIEGDVRQRFVSSDQSRFDSDGAGANGAMATHRKVAIDIDIHHAQVCLWIRRWQEDHSIHRRMPAWLAHQEAAQMIQVFFDIVLFLKHRVTWYLAETTGHDTRRHAFRVRIHRGHQFLKAHILSLQK